MNPGFTYIMSNKNRTTLYIGVTNNIYRRVWEHKSGKEEGFTKRYNLFDLLFYEEHNRIDLAILREKQLKNWKREWKWKLIKKSNPLLTDLAKEWYDYTTKQSP